MAEQINAAVESVSADTAASERLCAPNSVDIATRGINCFPPRAEGPDVVRL